MTSDLFFNPHVAALPRYNAGLTVSAARLASGRQDVARLGSNENPFGCSPAVLRALSWDVIEAGRYSDPACEALRHALACRLEVSAEEIVVGNGSEEMIAAASRSFLSTGSACVTVSPCFGLHEIEPLAVGAKVSKVPMTAAFDFDIPALAAALARKPHLVFIPSPWNPVGTALNADQLRELVRALSPSTLFVLDEAYHEFMRPGYPDGVKLLRAARVPHIVLRTFSKAWGLAGLRVGYAVCSDTTIARMLSVAKTPFNVNAIAQHAAVAALGDEDWMRITVRRIEQERERVLQELRRLEIVVAPSEANFLFIDTEGSSAAAAARLLQEAIIVKPWLEAGYDRYIRASIGTPPENDRLIASLERLIRDARAQPARAECSS